MEVITDVKCPTCGESVFIRGFPDNSIAFNEDSKDIHVCVGSEIPDAYCRSCGIRKNEDMNLVWVKEDPFWALMDKDKDDYHFCPEKIGRTNSEIDREIAEEKLRPSVGVVPSNSDIKRIQSWLTSDLFYKLFISQKEKFLSELLNTKTEIEKSITSVEGSIRELRKTFTEES